MREMIRVGLLASVFFTHLAWGADPLDEWTGVDTGGGETLRAITFGNGQFVMVGDHGVVFTSPDGAQWTSRDSGVAIGLNGITYGDGQFVAVGGYGDGTTFMSAILTSFDGITWTKQSPDTDTHFTAITYAQGRFVAGGYGHNPRGAESVWSSDGVVWTPWEWKLTDPIRDPFGLDSITYGNGLFVAVFQGNEGTVPVGCFLTSSNGEAWAKTRYPSGLSAVAFGNGQFAAAGGYFEYPQGGGTRHHSLIYSSTDGTNWTWRADEPQGGVMYAIAYGAGQFVAAGEYSTYSSPDGIKWTSHYTGGVARGVAYGNGRFVLAVGTGAMRSGTIGPKLGASLSPEGQFVGRVSGAEGQQFGIQTSTNLGSWNALTNVTVTNGVGTFTDPIGTNNTQRFYKALELNR